MAVETAEKQTCRVLDVCSEDFSPLARGNQAPTTNKISDSR